MTSQNPSLAPSLPYEWLKQLPLSIIQADEIPLFGKSPSFPWEQLATQLSQLFQIENIVLEPSNSQWRTTEDLLKGLGADPVFLYSSFAPLEGALGWVMPKSSIERMMQLLLNQPIEDFHFLNPEFEQGFYKFIGAQIIHLIEKLDFDKNLSPSLHDHFELPTGPIFCIDVTIKIKESSLIGRLIIPSDLRQSWKERYADRKLTTLLNSSLAQKIQVVVQLEVGKVVLFSKQLAALQPGDFFLLDSCSFEADPDKGRLMMTVDGTPLFRARLKQGSLKILEFPFYHEALSHMNKDQTDDDDFDDLTEESELEDPSDFSEDLTEEEDFSEEEDTEIEKTVQENSSPQDKTQHSLVEEVDKNSELKNNLTLETFSSSAKKIEVATDLPITLVVEIGRIQMSIQKLMELQPGNTLDLNIHPENGVDLVVNGRRIGKGELIKLGETLGIRLLDIG